MEGRCGNLLYFLHPTLVPPSNTAIVKGYNALTGAKVRLGKWPEYLAMREGVIRLNAQGRALLSNDLGAVAGLLFDIGSGRYPVPPADRSTAAMDSWQADLAKVREDSSREKRRREADASDISYTRVQGWLRDLGHARGFGVSQLAGALRSRSGSR